MAEVDTRFSVGERFRIVYDLSGTRMPSGIWNMRNQEEMIVEIVEIVCNMLIFPAEVWVLLKTEDPKFLAFYGNDVLNVEESRFAKRIIARV